MDMNRDQEQTENKWNSTPKRPDWEYLLPVVLLFGGFWLFNRWFGFHGADSGIAILLAFVFLAVISFVFGLVSRLIFHLDKRSEITVFERLAETAFNLAKAIFRAC